MNLHSIFMTDFDGDDLRDKMMEQENKCQDCRWYIRENEHDGKCYLDPPQICYPPGRASECLPKYVRPQVKSSDFCRYWEDVLGCS